jgi:hypothetical protein
MKPFAIAAASLLTLSAPAMAAKFDLALQPLPGQNPRMMAGIQSVDNHSGGSSVRLVPHEGAIKKRGTLQLMVLNRGQKPFDVGPENVTAKMADGTPVEIIPYERLLKEEKNRKTWRSIAAGLSAMNNSMSANHAGFVSGTAAYSGSTSGRIGGIGGTPFSSTTFGTATVSGYDEARANAARGVAEQQNNQTFANLSRENAAGRAAVQTNARTTTVDPEAVFNGQVVFELPKSTQSAKTDQTLTFIVNVGGEEHRFDALLKRQ